MEAQNEQIFIQKAEQYSSGQLKGEAMTLAQLFEEKGRKEGLEKGAKQTQKEMAQRMLKEGLNLDLIAKITDVPLEELQ